MSNNNVDKLIEENLKRSLSLNISQDYANYLFNDDNSNMKYTNVFIEYSFDFEVFQIYKPPYNKLQDIHRLDPYSYYYTLRDIFNITGVIIKETENGMYINNASSIMKIFKLKSFTTKFTQTNDINDNNIY